MKGWKKGGEVKMKGGNVKRGEGKRIAVVSLCHLCT
jgi:hypothetical protein